MKPPSQVGNGNNYSCLTILIAALCPARLILGVAETQSRADSNVRFDPRGQNLTLVP